MRDARYCFAPRVMLIIEMRGARGDTLRARCCAALIDTRVAQRVRGVAREALLLCCARARGATACRARDRRKRCGGIAWQQC